MADRHSEIEMKNQPDNKLAGEKAEREIKKRLVKLMQDAVPSVPRKINRVGELFDLYLNVAKLSGWDMREGKERLTLLRLVILQLLAPNIYRFGRHQKGFLSLIRDWVKEHKGSSINIDHILQSYHTEKQVIGEKLAQDTATDIDRGRMYVIANFEEPLMNLIQAAQQERSHFNPFNLFDLKFIPQRPSESDTDLDINIWRYFNLENTQSETAKVQWLEDEEKPTAALDNAESLFSMLFSSNESDWHRAIESESEKLTGKVFDDGSFEKLLNMTKSSAEYINADWLELIEPYVTKVQFHKLYQASNLLGRINNQLIDQQTQGGENADQ